MIFFNINPKLILDHCETPICVDLKVEENYKIQLLKVFKVVSEGLT